MEPIRIAFAGGGTGGHLLPGISVAQASLGREPGSRFLFLGTGRPAENAIFARYPFSRVPLDLPVPRRTPSGAVRFGRGILGAVARADRALGRFRPDVLVGLGGYASVPGVVGALRRGIPVYLMEQNARVGATTSWLAPLSLGVFCGYPSAARALGARGIPSGNPMRVDLLHHLDAARAPGSMGTKTLLVMGGSQGARGVNELMSEASPMLAALKGIRIVHLAGPDADRVRKAYGEAGLRDVEVSEFEPDVGRFLCDADLVVSRAGAMAVSEIAAFGRPAVYVPYPYAGAHQTDNAKPLERLGAASIAQESETSGERFADLVGGLLSDPKRLRLMASRCASFASPRAGEDVCRILFERAGKAG